MEYKIIASENLKSVSWSGGATTELFIYPPTADYQKRNFLFRLSISTVETEKSEFTLLSGVSRKLMVLSGNIILEHENHDTKRLSEFDVDDFEGDWKTTSYGKCTDFNLMTKSEATGIITALPIEKNQNTSYDKVDTFNWLFVYIYSGKVDVKINTQSIGLLIGDLLVLEDYESQDLEIKGIEKSVLVFSHIKDKKTPDSSVTES
jgi:environmental stress-induced protein Ves